MTLTTTYSHIPSVLIGKPQPTRPELVVFECFFFRNYRQSQVVGGKRKIVETFVRYEYDR